MEEVVAVIPVREGSTRIKNKNFLPFGDAPTLVHHKIRQVKAAGCFDHIYLSSDSEKVNEIAEECGVEFLKRDPFMCTSTPRWDEVIVAIMETIPGDPHVAWTLATGPVFSDYAKPVETYLSKRDSHDSLVGVRKLQEYIVDDAGRPLFYSFGPWHPYTNELKPLYIINDAFYIAKKSDQIRWRYWVGRSPYLYEMTSLESIDVNFPEDLELARVAHEYFSKGARA